MWDSTGPRGGLGAKFARALVSEIVVSFPFGRAELTAASRALIDAAATGDGLGAMTGGVGFNAGSFRMDYSFAPFGGFDTTRRFSLSMGF